MAPLVWRAAPWMIASLLNATGISKTRSLALRRPCRLRAERPEAGWPRIGMGRPCQAIAEAAAHARFSRPRKDRTGGKSAGQSPEAIALLGSGISAGLGGVAECTGLSFASAPTLSASAALGTIFRPSG